MPRMDNHTVDIVLKNFSWQDSLTPQHITACSIFCIFNCLHSHMIMHVYYCLGMLYFIVDSIWLCRIIFISYHTVPFNKIIEEDSSRRF
jgi:hypothetical protein